MSAVFEREALLSTKVSLQARGGTHYLARPRLREALETGMGALRGESAAAIDRLGDARAALIGPAHVDPVARALLAPQHELIEGILAEQRADYRP